jgi:hypothetical protein
MGESDRNPTIAREVSRSGIRRRLGPAVERLMANKTKATPQKEEAREKGPEILDARLPLLDLSDAAIKQAPKRGYVTYEQLNAIMPSEELTPRQIEEALATLNERGINVVETEEAGADDEEEREEPESGKPSTANRSRSRRRRRPKPAACKRLGLPQVFTKPYTPKTNGKAERSIQPQCRRANRATIARAECDESGSLFRASTRGCA